MTEMKSKRNLRTSGKTSQYAFDNLVADTDISGLTHLGKIYDDRLRDYKMSHDLNNPDYYDEFNEMQQRRKMITAELSIRIEILRNSDLASKDVHFNENYDIVYQDENGEIKVLRPSLTEGGTIEVIELDESDVRD